MVRQDPPGIDEARFLPEPFWAADRTSLAGQRLTLRWYRGLIVMLVAAAAVSAVPGPAHHGATDLTPLFSVAAFLVAGYFWYRLRQSAPEGRWYEARAVAESVKTLAWRYAMRARPFDGIAEAAEADQDYRRLIVEVLQTFADPAVVPLRTEPEITDEMRRTRAAPLAVRRNLYLRSRVEGQRNWYRSRAEACESQSASWAIAIAALMIIGAAAAVAQATGALSVHLFGFCSAAAAAVIAWTQLKQLRQLVPVYQLAARELDHIAVQLADLDLTDPQAEANWARSAQGAEETLAREHTTWRARRTIPH